MSLSRRLRTELTERLFPGIDPEALRLRPVGGGSINQTFQLCLPDGTAFFAKLNSATKFPHLFPKEADGLRKLGQTGTMAVPEVVTVLTTETEQLLLLQWIPAGERSPAFWEAFGHSLAALHRVTADRFGWHEDNYMGSVAQANGWMEDWPDFFRSRRLQPLAAACHRKGQLPSSCLSQLEQLEARLPQLFSPEPPAFVHGDLWSGNFICAEGAQPVLIDPAVYFGHRSVDLAMTTLFGGFAPRFYGAYHEAYPLPDQYREQWELCNLYPLLIHLLLFGSSYLHPIRRTLDRFS